MTFAEMLTLLDKLGTLLLAGMTLLINYRLGKMHKQFNSRMDQSLDTMKRLGKAEGKAEEKGNQENHNN